MTFTPSDILDYTTATATTTITVTPATPVIAWDAPGTIVYGTALSSVQLDASANLPGTLSYTPAAGTILGTGSDTLSVTFTPQRHSRLHDGDGTDHDHRDAGHARDRLGRPRARSSTALPYELGPARRFPPTCRGTFSYTPAAGTILGCGGDTLSATFTPSDTLDYTTAKSGTDHDHRDAGHARDRLGRPGPDRLRHCPEPRASSTLPPTCRGPSRTTPAAGVPSAGAWQRHALRDPSRPATPPITRRPRRRPRSP